MSESDTQRVLDCLQAARGGWCADLYRRTACMVHSRIAELRRRGYVIECKRFGQGDYRYRLLGSADALRGTGQEVPR